MGTPAQRHRWRPRRRRDRGNTRRAPGTGTVRDQTAPGESAPGDTVAAAMQLAIGLLTASLDSPELEAWALAALTPRDADGLGNFMAGLHVVSELLLRELHEATGSRRQPPCKGWRSWRSTGEGPPPPARAASRAPMQRSAIATAIART